MENRGLDANHQLDIPDTNNGLISLSNPSSMVTLPSRDTRSSSVVVSSFPNVLFFSMESNNLRNGTTESENTDNSVDSVSSVEESNSSEGTNDYFVSSTVEASQREDTPTDNQSPEEIDEQMRSDIWHIVFRLQNIFPFVFLLLVYFAYHHTKGIVYFTLGTGSLSWLDQKFRAQVPLKENINKQTLAAIVLVSLCDLYLLFVLGATPWRQLVLLRLDESPIKNIWDVLWIIMLNDFAVRTCSVIIKVFVACLKSGYFAVHCASCSLNLDRLENGTASPSNIPRTALYRRKRRVYAIVEFVSLFIRTLIAAVPWCQFYQASESKVVADLFTFSYVFIKGIILVSQARHIKKLLLLLQEQHLDFGTYVSPQSLMEAESPDCSICYDRMINPIQLHCSHMFCEECVSEWFDREGTCPLCRADVSRSSSSPYVKPRFLDGSTAMVPQLF